MTRKAAPPDATFGYLSTWDSPEHGCLGGYLIVSHLGRPLEFHCTAPVQSSRAQQILYGPTLWPYLFGEQIAVRLVNEAKLRPYVLLVDHPATFSMRERFNMPMLLPRRSGNVGAGSGASESLIGADSVKRLPDEGAIVFEFAPGFDRDRQDAADVLSQLAIFVDLLEPFERIHEAIREAQRLGAAGEGSDARAA